MELTPPKGYRFLEVGELILSTDLFLPNTVPFLRYSDNIRFYEKAMSLDVGRLLSGFHVPFIRKSTTIKGNSYAQFR